MTIQWQSGSKVLMTIFDKSMIKWFKNNYDNFLYFNKKNILRFSLHFWTFNDKVISRFFTFINSYDNFWQFNDKVIKDFHDKFDNSIKKTKFSISFWDNSMTKRFQDSHVYQFTWQKFENILVVMFLFAINTTTHVSCSIPKIHHYYHINLSL